MPSAKELQRRLNKASKLSLLQKEVEKIVLTDTKIRELKRDEFERGRNPDGSAISPAYRSASYKAFKQSTNPKAQGRVDLIFTGAFVNQLFQKSLGSSKFLFDSQNEKTSMLRGKYGKRIFGLNKETFLELQQTDYRDKLVRKIRQITAI
jgi:hypothetical protein